ncbi:MAG: DNA alkylation repair protein [Planctomycetaceae bacterium]|nr:DNA alkylation repair protein [Planctomycetaceae bacterium]
MAEPLKNYYSRDYINTLSKALKRVETGFDSARFRKRIFSDSWDDKELKARMQHIARTLHHFLPQDYSKAIGILSQVVELLPRDKNSGYLGMYFPEFVSFYGRDDWETSLPALGWFTRFASSEFAVRPFILDDPPRMMTQMHEWAQNADEHLRRLASEGCRPRLPWAMALPLFKQDPRPVLKLLEGLKEDKSRYVQKSVANNLNDISKDNPELVLKTTKRWQGRSPETDWILKQACRTLLKQSHPEALKLFGLQSQVDRLKNFTVNQPMLKLGEELEFSVSFHVKQKCVLRVEYLIDYLKKNGTHSTKVFQWAEREFEKGTHDLSSKQRFEQFTTRKHYSGAHRIRVRINGREFKPVEFELQI